mgnify:CR=1 FL=1
MKKFVNTFFRFAIVVGLGACGGGGGGSGNSQNSQLTPTTPPAGGDDVEACAALQGPFSQVIPSQEWQESTPEAQGMCSDTLQDALDYAFAQGNSTGAVLVVKNGYIVAERYSDSRGQTDLVTSWSVAKSFTSALLGVAVERSEIDGMDQRLAHYIPRWAGTEKAAITVRDLMTVRTALDLIGDPDKDGVPDGADLYGANDQLTVSLDRPLVGTPGEKLYTYSNADVMIAGELLRSATGVSAAEYLPLAFGEAIGFSGQWWTDGAGNSLTYCCLDAVPRDFARFGLLFARDGLWGNDQLISESWIADSTLAARGGAYSYFWWPAVEGGFAALGVQGQVVAVYPEDDLVIIRFSEYERNGDGSTVRTGENYHVTEAPENFDVTTFVRLVREALAVRQPTVQSPVPAVQLNPNQVSVVGSRTTLWAGGSQTLEPSRNSFRWSLSGVPAGSEAVIQGIGETVYLIPDLPGQYTIELVVGNGRSDSPVYTTSIEAVAGRDVLVAGTRDGAWPNYAGNLSSDKFSPLHQISAENIDQLEVVWRWRSPDNDITTAQNSVFEATPLMIDGVLYTSTSFSQVAAIDAATGQTLWVYDPAAYRYARPPNNGFLHRGVSYFEDHQGKKIHMPTGDARLIALDAINGKPVETFGTLGNGSVNLLSDVPRLNQSTLRLDNAHNQPDVPDLAGVVSQLGHSSPGIVCDDVLILGSQVHDGEVLPPTPPGDVRGFDLNTGERLWTFHTVPREGEYGVDTWGESSWQNNGNTNVWAPMSADSSLNMVYLPVSCPTNNYYGGRRPGDNLFANSVVALDCRTGERQWHYQTVHHDIWDYDLPAAPNLIDITVDNRPRKALAQVSKQGFVYVLDRQTGEPIWPIVETPVPQSDVPGEVTSATQPIPTKPPPFVRQGVVREDFIDPSSIENFDIGPIYTPPNTRGLVMTPGEGGGANWGGASFDPGTQILYVNGFGPLTYVVQLQKGNESNLYYVFPEPVFGPSSGSPYPGLGSAITAYDMNKGEILWQQAGDENTTIMGNSASMIAGDLLFYKNSALNTLNILDKFTGEILRAVPLNGRPTGSPMTYMWQGVQYVVVALGRQDELTELVALALVSENSG